jgi:hypothetical protein
MYSNQLNYQTNFLSAETNSRNIWIQNRVNLIAKADTKVIRIFK